MPRQRGIVCPFHWSPRFWLKPLRPWPYCRGAPKRWDWKFHFPAGDKSVGADNIALRSQIRAAGRAGWTPYEPTRRGFVFRAGACGDTKWGKQHHLRGGRYYWPRRKPAIVATYVQGGTFTATLKITENAHHNGYVEFILCDVKKCGGEISKGCLRNGRICRKLVRKWEFRCELGRSKDCAPIDPNYPTRWYLPCSRTIGTKRHDFYKNVRYLLPGNVVCKHCVIQWYWVSGNQCNPPGLVHYFRGPRGPRWWGNCRGQSNARGGYAGWMKTCGGRRFSEEYYQCADIRILPRGRRYRPRPYPRAPRNRGNPLRFIRVYVNGRPWYNLNDGAQRWVGGARVGIEAVTWKRAPIKFVQFTAEGLNYLPAKQTRRPYFFGGPRARWNIRRRIRLIRGRWFWIQATAVDPNGRHHFISVRLHF